MNLLERLLPRIDTVSNSIRRGEFSGMCYVTYRAHKAGEITTAEYDALWETIDAYTTEHHAGYVVFHLVPEFDDMTDNSCRFTFPNDVSERAAQLWKGWAIDLVSQVQETLNVQ